MPHLIARVQELVEWRTKNGQLHVRSLAVPTEGRTKELFGEIFGVVSLKAPPKAGDALVASIETALARIMTELIEDQVRTQGPAPVFETVVARLNLSLARQFDAEQLPLDPAEVNSALVAQRGCEITAAAWGEPCLLLVHPASGGIALADLLQDPRSEREKAVYDPALRRGFSQIMNGSIGRQDRLLVATSDLRELLGKDKLASIIAANDPGSAAVVLNDILAPLSDTLAIAALVSDAVPPEQLATAPTVSAPPVPTAPGAAPKNEFALNLKKALATAAVMGRIVMQVVRVIISGEQRRALKKHLSERLNGSASGLVARFNDLSRIKKFTWLAALVLVFSLNAAAAAAGVRRAERLKLDADAAKISAIDQQLTAAEASMVYDDDAAAKNDLTSARDAAATLPEKTDAQKEAKSVLMKKIDDRFAALRHVAPLAPADVIATVNSSAGAPSLERMVLTPDGIWSLSSQGELFKSSLKAGTTVQIAGAKLAGAPAFLAAGESTVVAGSADGSVVSVTLAGTASPRSVQFGGDVPIVADAGLYGGRLYILDAKHNRILRYNSSSAGFGKAGFYLKDGTDVSNAVNFVVDGSVYVLSKDGSVAKLTKGLRDDFANEAAEPAVANATTLAATAGRLYILDPDQNRVIALDKKSGKIAAQFTSPALKEVRDIAAAADDSYLLAATGNRILRFDLTKK